MQGRMSHLADQRIFVHRFLKKNRGVANVITGHQMIGVVHTSWMYREPVNDTYWFVVHTDEFDLRQLLIDIVFISENKSID